MRLRTSFLFAGFVLALGSIYFPALGFLPPQDTDGPLTVLIADPGEIKELGQPLPITITVKNGGSSELQGTLRVTVIDDWRVEDGGGKAFSVEAGAAQSLTFNVTPGVGSFAALYPIHAWAELQEGSTHLVAHAVLITSVSASAVADAHPAELPVLKLSENGRLTLDRPGIFQPSIALVGINPVAKQIGWQGTDDVTGAFVQLLDVDRGAPCHALAMHPAWRKGWGDVFADYRVEIPVGAPVALHFATAIRDNAPTEPPSDGVEFRVLVGEGHHFETLFTHFSAAKHWEPATVDLSAYAGRTVTLRLVTDPGPAHNTSCDLSYWAEPTLVSGESPTPESDASRTVRRQQAIDLAVGAWQGQSSVWSWKLESSAGTTGAAIVPGPCGLADAFIAFADGQHQLVFEGFTMQVDGQGIGESAADLPCSRVENRFDAGRGTITAYVPHGDGLLALQASVWSEKGALRIAFSMPGAQRDIRGEPRFTTLAIGPASELAHRVYAGFGNVLQDPQRFDLESGGFTLSTRHVGMDFTNGLSLVQATDIFPDRFHVDPEQRSYSLVAHHDATFSLIPSTRQAFAAARVYHDLVDFKPAGGVANLLGRMCLDQWAGDYRQAAQDVESAAAYGVTDAVFVKHVWQRWGYDYRLPEIYPPNGNKGDFLAMVEACKQHGILFSPHDNYIDFYPDATGFSYDHIIFNADGTPQKAWFNPGREAQSYRWSPNDFGPSLESNLQQIKTGFAPTAYFVDVFSAIAPIDFYDRQGRFYPKTVTAERWGGAFDRIREILGNGAPTISEAGQDGLISHLDAGEADHAGWLPDSSDTQPFHWNMKAADGERIPWHDMASHGSFLLLGGGLGPRYAGGQDETLHGYGSDDYLCTTVMGGRSPMCDGPFSRRTVMTYWLLHDICGSLARREILADEFADDDIHRQTVTFSDGGVVHVNRGKSDWTAGDVILPPYGFTAKAGDNVSGITRRNGIISAFASSPGLLFVDARPNVSGSNGQVIAQVTGVDDLGNRRFRLHIDWQILQPLPSGFRPFVHFVNAKNEDKNEGILFQTNLTLDPAKLATAGSFSSSAEATVPASLGEPADIAIRFGLYQTGAGGQRLPFLVAMDGSNRVRGGGLHVTDSAVTWQPEPIDPTKTDRLNVTGQMVDFGPASTNGAFRLIYSGTDLQLIPLPNSPACKVDLRLNLLDASDLKVQTVTATDIHGNTLGQVDFQQDGQTMHLETSAGVFAYHLSLTK